jgi:hypothetical protein
MKANLLELGLPENVVDGILDVFDTYKQTLKQYSKPKGRIAFQNNMKEIESLCRKLKQRFDELSNFEKQLLSLYCSQNVFDLKTNLIILEFACQESRKKEIRFSRKEPFILSLTIDLWELLDSNGIAVKKYKNNILCKVLKTLFPLPLPDQTEDVLPEDIWAFHLLREASRRISRS